MVKYEMFVLAFLLFCKVQGIPTSGKTTPESTPRVKDWISFNPPWSFPSFPSLFHDNTEDASRLMKKRIENLEKSQKSMLELLKNLKDAILNSTCNAENTPENPPSDIDKPIIPDSEKLHDNPKEKPQVSSTSVPTSPVLQSSTSTSTTTNQPSTTRPEDNQSETTIRVDKSTTTSVKNETITTPQTEDFFEVVTVQSIEVPPNENKNSPENSTIKVSQSVKNKRAMARINDQLL